MINQDSFGNTYLGYMNSLENGIFITQNDFNNFLDTAIGSNRYFINTSVQQYHILLPSSQEPFSAPATVNNGRFVIRFTGAGSFGAFLNSSNNPSSAIYLNTYTQRSTSYADQGFFTYAVCNSDALVIAQLSRSGNIFTGTQSIEYFGYLKNPAYTGSNSILNASILGIRTAGGNTSIATRSSATNSSTDQLLATSTAVANYPITCVSATPNATTTDLILRDNTSPNYAIGACHNLLKTTANVSVGQIFSLTTDPDNNTQQNKWLCVGNWGSEKLLMRIWTENII